MVRLLIVDDDQLVSLSLKTILSAQEGIEVVGTGNSGQEGIRLYEQTRPDVLLMDIRMGDMTGIDAATIILKKFPEALIIFLTTFLDNEYVVQSLKIGAKGYILKKNFDSLIPSIQAVSLGQTVFGDQIMNRLPELLATNSTGEVEKNLSEGEQRILVEIANGLNNKEIALKLFLSEGTIRNYISVMLEKLSLRDRTQLAIYFYKNN